MLRGRKTFSFHFFKPFSFKFWILGELESANFGCWVVCAINCYLATQNTLVFLWIHCELETKTVSNFPHFRREFTNSDVISFVSDNFPTIFPLWRLKTVILTLETSESVYLILNRHIRLKRKKMCKAWFIDLFLSSPMLPRASCVDIFVVKVCVKSFGLSPWVKFTSQDWLFLHRPGILKPWVTCKSLYEGLTILRLSSLAQTWCRE